MAPSPCIVLCFFFFSSRRRHTRLVSDWSSDVCSSDLQIRIHLAERGHLLLGERGYVREHRGELIAAPRILLHAAELGFEHPATGAPLRFTEPMPADMAAVVASRR